MSLRVLWGAVAAWIRVLRYLSAPTEQSARTAVPDGAVLM